ncbi:hypothetical protein [Bradyrhizobium liaoningense]|uniref:hypothetical protein n=1 Tax=Bradyrhizobium liaoningense TaxID=43992 RepID=UPI001BAA4A3D|nr:hypothetical protein [Bradyrhizobium liaoningense]MBR0859155.1 hypothetical protein [Bradyrhizobium liaoningense]
MGLGWKRIARPKAVRPEIDKPVSLASNGMPAARSSSVWAMVLGISITSEQSVRSEFPAQRFRRLSEASVVRRRYRVLKMMQCNDYVSAQLKKNGGMSIFHDAHDEQYRNDQRSNRRERRRCRVRKNYRLLIACH